MALVVEMATVTGARSVNYLNCVLYSPRKELLCSWYVYNCSSIVQKLLQFRLFCCKVIFRDLPKKRKLLRLDTTTACL